MLQTTCLAIKETANDINFHMMYTIIWLNNFALDFS